MQYTPIANQLLLALAFKGTGNIHVEKNSY